MEDELKDMQPLLEEAAKETETTMEKIATDSVIAADTKKEVEKEEAEATIKAGKAQEIADDAQRDLDEALPALEAALSSLRLAFHLPPSLIYNLFTTHFLEEKDCGTSCSAFYEETLLFPLGPTNMHLFGCFCGLDNVASPSSNEQRSWRRRTTDFSFERRISYPHPCRSFW